MDTNPSGQDEKQAEEYNGKYPWLLRIIANKKGKIRCDLFWFEYGFILKDVDWEIDYASNMTEYESSITQQAKKVVHAPVYSDCGRWLYWRCSQVLPEPSPQSCYPRSSLSQRYG
jgi:hypothetical protein